MSTAPGRAGPRRGAPAYAAPTATDDRVGTILESLRGQGERITTARRALLTALAEAGGHRSAEELATEVARLHPEVHRATIYRTLETLRRLRVVEHTHLGHGPAVYHLADEVHQHLVCEECGAVVEVPASVFRPLERALERDYGFTVSSRHFAVVGRCHGCVGAAGPHAAGPHGAGPRAAGPGTRRAPA
ncbi:MAG: Fur family transcriptional regulator [Acidimicrobiales bacterium]